MTTCGTLCRLPDAFDQLPLDEQARMILRCRIRDAAEFRLCAERQRALAEWISRE